MGALLRRPRALIRVARVLGTGIAGVAAVCAVAIIRVIQRRSDFMRTLLCWGRRQAAALSRLAGAMRQTHGERRGGEGQL